MELSKISIVTPSFNQGQYIEQTICSVLDQGYPNLEYIVMDGGSTDNTVSILKKYERHLDYWVSEPDKGQTDAINKGFARCTGAIFNWINSDDYYEPGVFHRLASLFADERIDVVCGREWSFDDSNPANRDRSPGSVLTGSVFDTIRVGIINQPCTFFRREKISPFFPLNTAFRYIMDKQLWWQYLFQYGQQAILEVDEVFTNFRLHPKSKSIAEAANFSSEYELMIRNLFRQLDAPPILYQALASVADTVPIEWAVQPGQRERVLAAFASFFAGRSYVRKNRSELRQFTALLKRWKGNAMSGEEWKWWLAANALPSAAFRFWNKELSK